MASNSNYDEQWEDLVRRLGGSPYQSKSQPIPEVPPGPKTPDSSSGPVPPPRDYTVAEETVEDFQPPEPKPIASGNPRTVLSWTAVIGSVTVWLFAALLSIPLSWWITTVTVASFLAGALSLFFLLPQKRTLHEPHDDDDYGNGAKL